MRFSLRNLFLIIALLALACAGMTYRNRWWLMGITTLTLAIYGLAALNAVVRRGRQRTVWAGFCIIGFGYFFLATQATWNIGQWLPTTVALAATANAIQIPIQDLRSIVKDSEPASQSSPEFGDYLDSVPLLVYGEIQMKAFFFIGHCLWSLLLATLAAWLVGRMYDRHNPPTKVSP